MDWVSWIKESLQALRNLRLSLGDQATSPGENSDLGKRQTLFEEKAFRLIQENLPANTAFEAEGCHVIDPTPGSAFWIVGLDPTDGTAGDARFSGIASLASSLPVSCVLSVRENVSNPTFSSVKYAGILNLRDGQMFWASEDGAFQTVNSIERRLIGVTQYNLHAPAIACEIARRANSFLRYLVPYGVYPEVFADSHSSAMVMLWALTGYCDLYFNANMPGITDAGQRGHELGAISVFSRAMKAYAVATVAKDNRLAIKGSLDDAPYVFDGQTSVVIGVDKQIVCHYLELVNTGLRREVKFHTSSGQKLTSTIGEVIAELYRQYPNERWSLPLVGGNLSI